MSATLDHANITLKIDSKALNPLKLSGPDDSLLYPVLQLFANGTGANQASQQWHDERTLTASSTETLNLSGTGLVNAFGVTVTFTAIKALLIRAAAANTNDVIVGGAGSNGWITWVGGATHTVTVKPGGLLLLVAPVATGYVVTAATAMNLKIANSSSGTSVVYDVWLLGND